jgi:hypothetical protein
MTAGCGFGVSCRDKWTGRGPLSISPAFLFPSFLDAAKSKNPILKTWTGFLSCLPVLHYRFTSKRVNKWLVFSCILLVFIHLPLTWKS